MIKTWKKKLFNIGNIISLALLFCVWGYIIFTYPSLPKQIPLQFDSAGNVNSYGDRYMIFILPIVYTITWLRCFRFDKIGFIAIDLLNKTAVLRIIAQLLSLVAIIFLIKYAILRQV